MSRSLGLRLPDAQYEWLIERTIEFDGDLSEATRDAIDAARMFDDIIASRDPHAKLQELLENSRREADREAFYDEFGHYPDEEPRSR